MARGDPAVQVFRIHGKPVGANAHRVHDRGANRRRDRNQADLGDTLGAIRAGTILVLNKGILNLERNVLDAGQEVVAVVRIGDDPVLAYAAFPQRLADTHDHAAVDLALGAGGIDHGARVMGGPAAYHLDPAQLLVHLHLHHVGAEGVGRIGIAGEFQDIHGDIRIELAIAADILDLIGNQGAGLLEAQGVVADDHPVVR